MVFTASITNETLRVAFLAEVCAFSVTERQVLALIGASLKG